MSTTIGEINIVDNVAKKALQIHVEAWAHLEAVNAKYKAKADKHQHKKAF